MPVDVAVAVAYNPEKEKFLVLKRSDFCELNPGKWNFPSGKIEAGEKASEAALRELEEETGLKGELVRSGETFESNSAGKTFKVHPFLVIVNGEVFLNKEHSDYAWMEASEISELDGVDDLERNLDSLGVDY